MVFFVNVNGVLFLFVAYVHGLFISLLLYPRTVYLFETNKQTNKQTKKKTDGGHKRRIQTPKITQNMDVNTRSIKRLFT